MNALRLAADLWANPLAPPAEVTGTSDPQSPYRWAGDGVLFALGAGLCWSAAGAQAQPASDIVVAG